MLGVRLLRAATALLGGVALAAPAAAGAALPSVGSGERPGPPILYEPAPNAPQLSVAAPFSAAPLLVSGTDAYRDGEYLYQDYLFDDRGADTSPGVGSRPDASDSTFSPTAGDVQYPTDPRYAGNAADLVEFRVKATATDVIYRVTLNSVLDPDTTVVGIGIDTDLSGGAAVAWPNGAGVSSPGLDRFITAWGTAGELTSFPGGDTPLPAGAVTINTTTKQMTIAVPKTLLDPGMATWRYVAGSGLWDTAAGAWKTPSTSTTPGIHQPASGSVVNGAPAVFNLAFRFDEPQARQPPPPTPPYTTGPGTGNWWEDKQAVALDSGTTAAGSAGAPPAGGDDFFADVDFAKLAAGVDEDVHAPEPTQARILASSLDLPQGVRQTFPQYRGQLQPYVLRVPAGLDTSQPTGLTFALHSLGGTYTQFAVFSPNQYVELGDQRDNLVATPLGHGPDGWYTNEGEADVFEVWADINRHFNLDPDRAYVSGYSMGGYGTYKLGVEYPDLWSKAFTTVGPPGEGIWIPPGDPSSGAETLTHDLLENVRWVPFMNWAGSTDELVPVVGPQAQQERFDALGLRSSLFIFAPADHFALAIADEWDGARDFLGDAETTRDPWRVDYGFFPAADRPGLGLVHDHAYWVSELVARDTSDDGIRGFISARSLAHGLGDPTTQSVSDAGAPGDAGPPLAFSRSATDWTGTPTVPPQNTLQADLENLASGEIDGARARLDGSRELRVELVTDGPADLGLDLALPANAEAVRLAGGVEVPAPEVSLQTSGADFHLDGPGSRTYLIRPGSSAVAPTCRGRSATIVGTSGDDRGPSALRGTPGDDVIVGMGGKDRLKGRGGDDLLCGNSGRDVIRGGGGADSCYGGPGRDRIARSCELARSPRRARR